MSNNKSRSNKPYDSSNSFVKKVASRVSGLIPRSTSWLSGWFAPTTGSEQDSSSRVEEVNEAEHFEDAITVEQPPPPKRFKLNTNQQYVDTYPVCQTVEQGESSSRLTSNNYIDTSAIPGPSGLGVRSGGFIASTPAVTSVQHLEPKANGDDCSESGESTSGCSSLEPQMNRGLPSAQSQSRQNDSMSPRKRLLDDKLNYSYLQNSRSLFLDRSSSHNNQTVGRRNNPSFCVNTFGTPLYGERGSVNDLILNSPFYAGRTTYGGASSASYRRSLGSASLSSSPANSEKLGRHTIKVKPGNTHTADDTSMSQTAKRILATLEQFSTPILDAKRIPVSQAPVLSSLGSRKRSRMDDAPQILEQPRIPKRISNKPMHWAKGAPSTSQLTIPRTPDTLVLRRRELVHEGAPIVAPLASGSTDTYKLRTEIDNNHSTRNMLKMKPRLDKEPKEPEMALEVNLPEVPLVISSLPTFDISVPAPKSDATKSNLPSMAIPSGISSLNKSSPLSRTSTGSSASSPFKSSTEAASTDASFSFSSPISVSAATKVQPLTPVNNFTFSKPLPASLKFAEPSPNCVKARPKSSIDSPKQVDDFPCGLKPASELKTGSVMDILGKSPNDVSKNISSSANGGTSLMDKFKPAAGTWECDKCLIRNKSDLSKCAACENPREEKTKPKAGGSSETKTVTIANASPKEDSGFGTQFKMAQGMWECSACMVRNKDLDTKCVSCTTPKPGAAPPKTTTPGCNFSGWGDKFKPPSNTWECNVCMVRNGSELSSCQSCTTKKPGSSAESVPPIKSSWGDQFKKPEGSWTCNDCMVSNKAADSKCVACSARKPGAPPSPKQSVQFNFGIPAGGASGSKTPAFSFGVPKNSTEGNESEKSSVSSSTGFKFGEKKSEAPTAVFSFGVPPSAPTVPASTSSSAPTSASLLAAGPAASSPSPSLTSSSLVAKATEATASPSSGLGSNAQATFLFGAPAAPSAPEEKSTPALMFAFSKPAVSAVTSQPASSSTVSPLGGKRKFGGDTPSSSAVPVKFGIMTDQANPASLTKPEVTTASSVSSTSGPTSSFASAAVSTSNTAAVAGTISTTVTSSANSQKTIEVAKMSASSPFASLVSSPSAVTPSKPALPFGMNAVAKDESVTSTWKSAAPSNAVDDSKPSSENSVGTPKPGFSFGSNVSSSGMAFGSNANAGTANFSFGASTDKTTSANKPITFGSPASSTTLFGSGPGNVTTAPSFGSSGSSGFGSLSTSSSGSGQTFPASNSISSSFSAPATTGFPSFGSSTLEEKNLPFSFGSTNEPKKSTGFDFNAASEEKKPFTFGGTDESKKPFSFSATNATAATTSQNAFSSSSVFTFGAPAPATNGPEKPNFAFGTVQNSTFAGFNSQQQSSATGFNFGATTPAPSFGSAAVSAAPAPAPLPFDAAGSTAFTPAANFSSPFAANSQPSSGFNFASPANSFSPQNPGLPFSFGNGAPKANFSFTANPTPSDPSGAPVQRVIRKAARRNKNIR